MEVRPKISELIEGETHPATKSKLICTSGIHSFQAMKELLFCSRRIGKADLLGLVFQ
jgi:hypothetical protein